MQLASCARTCCATAICCTPAPRLSICTGRNVCGVCRGHVNEGRVDDVITGRQAESTDTCRRVITAGMYQLAYAWCFTRTWLLRRVRPMSAMPFKKSIAPLRCLPRGHKTSVNGGHVDIWYILLHARPMRAVGLCGGPPNESGKPPAGPISVVLYGSAVHVRCVELAPRNLRASHSTLR